MKKKSKKFDFDNDPAYQELLADLRKIIDEARVKGVDFNRPHFLNCYFCECEEGMTKMGSRCIYLKNGTTAGLDVDFTVIDVKRRAYALKNGNFRWRTTYHYICGVCGAEQRVAHVDECSKNQGSMIKKGKKV